MEGLRSLFPSATWTRVLAVGSAFLFVLGFFGTGLWLIKQDRQLYAELQLTNKALAEQKVLLEAQTTYYKLLEELQQKAYEDHAQTLDAIHASATQAPVGPGVHAYFDQLCRHRPLRCPSP